MTEGDSWKHRDGWYEKHDTELTKALLNIKRVLTDESINPSYDRVDGVLRIIDRLNLESGWKQDECARASLLP